MMRAQDRVTVTERRGLLNEVKAINVRAYSHRERAPVAGRNYEADFLYAGLKHFFEQNREGRFGLAIAIHQRLQRQIALVTARDGDDGFADFHFNVPNTR